ncbi:DUF2800 domain-containing protein [bacterium]|nr:DUF2800 domain-containing protein [bacterium]
MHSNIVGGSTAKRVVNCPGSVALVQKMPPRVAGDAADQGTLCHSAMAMLLEDPSLEIKSVLGMTENDQTMTEDLIDEKIVPAMAALNEIDPDGDMEYKVESHVNFGKLLPGVFGSADLIGRIDDRAIILDWKFGRGEVDVEENEQLLFYAAAAMRTKGLEWAFEGVSEVEMVIVQPPAVKRWTTTVARVKQFERELVAAVTTSAHSYAPLSVGDHCRYCPAKPICPQMTGAAERALRVQIKDLDPAKIGEYLATADLVEDEDKAYEALVKLGAQPDDLMETTLLSPAKVEKILKKSKLSLPDDIVVAVSSGTTIAPESDSRSAVVFLPEQMKTALSKLG